MLYKWKCVLNTKKNVKKKKTKWKNADTTLWGRQKKRDSHVSAWMINANKLCVANSALELLPFFFSRITLFIRIYQQNAHSNWIEWFIELWSWIEFGKFNCYFRILDLDNLAKKIYSLILKEITGSIRSHW